MAIVHFTFQRSEVPAGAVNVKGSIQAYEREERGPDFKPTGLVHYGPFPLWTWETHNGLCLFEREHNMRDDSDFHMYVWNEEKQDVDDIMFASTRGWSYPSMASYVDATPEIKAKYAALVAKREEAERVFQAERRAHLAATTPNKGTRVKLVRNAKHKGETFAKGLIGTVTWFGKDQFKVGRSSRYMTGMQASIAKQLHARYGDPRENMRVGVRFEDGRTAFLNAQAVEVTQDEEVSA